MKEWKRHALFWALIYLVWTYIKSNGGKDVEVFLVINLFNLANYMVAFYTLKHFFKPLFFDHGKYVLFLLSLVATSVCLYFFLYANDVTWAHEFGSWEVPPITFQAYLQKTIQHYSPAMILLAWESHLKSVDEQKRIQELENEKLATELKFLKAQLNPHFLFNTLNNLYAQVITRSGKAPAMILQLSGILDYVLYQSQQKAVPLAEEVAVIKDFIAIEAIRYGARLKVEFSVAGSLTIAVPPLLFLSLVENAFKHGVSKGIDRARVKIEIREHRGEVSCKIWNTKSDFQPVRRDDHRKGLGLSNVKRQLTISHPDAHSLQIAEEATAFCVTVVIK